MAKHKNVLATQFATPATHVEVRNVDGIATTEDIASRPAVSPATAAVVSMYPDVPPENIAAVEALLEELRASDDTSHDKKTRAKLRKLGHRGGLRERIAAGIKA